MYNAQTQFFDQMIRDWRWTADPRMEEVLRRALELHLEWARECFDPDDDGLYESYINLTGTEAVLQAVQDCYHCLWQPRAAHYRTIKGIDHRKEAMAVVVMQTVPSFASGVAFTLNPVTGATDEVLINAS